MLQGQQFYPMSFPRIPQEEILNNLALQKIVLELASTLEVGMLFHTTEELNWVCLCHATSTVGLHCHHLTRTVSTKLHFCLFCQQAGTYGIIREARQLFYNLLVCYTHTAFPWSIPPKSGIFLGILTTRYNFIFIRIILFSFVSTSVCFQSS